MSEVRVASYLLKETEDLVVSEEALTEWTQAAERLGLEGQLTLTKEEKSPIPFLHMNRRLKGVFKVLCPSKVEVKGFKVSAIPLEVMRLLELSEREGYFERVEVCWDDEKQDPIAVGHSVEKESYLIARWGAEAKSLEQLEREAYERCKRSTKMRLEEKMAECKHKLDKLESVVEDQLNDGYFWV